MFVTSTQRVTMSGQQQSPDVERQNLLDRLLDAVKQCQVRFGGKTELATDGDSRVTCLLTQFEAVLQHGFKRSRSRISAFRQVGQVAGIVKLDSDSVFWSFVKEHLGKLDVERFLSLEKATTDAGRGRAWLRSSLNEHSLERYFHYMIQNKALLSQFYEKEAFMMDEERTSMLPMMAAGLSPILFALTVDSEELNIVRQVPALTINKDVLSNILPSFPQKPVAEPPPVYSAALTTTEDSKLDKKKKKKKKKKRVHAAIVSIEEDDSGTRDLPLTDSSVQNNDHTSRASTHGHARSSSYPGNKAVVPEGSTASVNGGEIVFTEISKSISLPDNSVTDSAVENNSTVIRSFDYEDFEGHLTGGKYVGEGEEETLSLDDRENFNFGSVDLFQRESKLERVVNISPQDIAEKEGNESNVAAMPVQTERKGNSSFDIQSITEIKRSNTNLSTTEKEKPDVTEKQSADIKSTKESCYFTPVASVEGFSDMRRTTPVRSNVDFGASSSNEQRLEALADVRSRTTNQQGVEEVENELEPDQDLDDCDEMTISEPQQVYTGDDEVEPVVVLDSGESLVPLMEGGHATKASAQSAFDNASEFTVDKDRDSASLSSTSWSYIEEGEEFTEAKDELNNGSGSMAAASDAAAALAACSDVQRGMAHMNRGFTTMERTVGDRTSYQENVNKHEGMSTGELKQAIVSMMLKKDEIEEQNRNLGNLLNEERQKSEQLNSEREELREEMKQQDIRQSRQIGSLSRENELLKHQLKKYVGAVQALKSDLHGKSSEAMEALQGIRQEEILPSLPPEQGTEEERLSEEAEEYKRKLIQVADLHGELMEFNERLQRQIGFYQSQIRRLREELINLRGPLPEDSEVPHDVTNLSDFDPAVMSVGTRPLVNVWIPSVFLRGRSSNVHHVYQVYVRIKDDEWNVYRRYSQFFEMHKNLRRRYPVVDSFKFPPKKALGNKDSRFVEDRRRLLQDYVRRVVNLYATCDQELISSTTKPTLILILPFFGDPFPPEKTKKESTSRRKRSAHYTGL